MHDAHSEPPSSPLELRHASTDHPTIVVVPTRRLLVIEGVGQLGAADFRLASGVLRGVHDRVRASLRHDRFDDGPKAIMEVAWPTDAHVSLDDLARALSRHEPLHWRQMIELPRLATTAAAEAAILETRLEGGRDVPLVRLISFAEGRSVQILQVGAAADLVAAIERLGAFVAESGLRPHGSLHQLVFGDPDVVPPDRARSILRMPIE